MLHTRVVSGTGGGPDKTILNSARFLEPEGYRVLAAYMHPRDDPGFAVLEANAARWRSELIGVPERGALDLRVLRTLLRICRERRVTIWHGHDYKSNLFGLLLRPFHEMRLVTTVHGWGVEGPRTKLYYAIDRWCLRRYERVICVSEKLLGECRDARVPEERLMYLQNGIDTDDFRRGAAAAEGGVLPVAKTPGRQVVVGVGRLSAEKGFALLVRAVDRLAREGLDLELWIVGEGPERAAIEREAAAAGDPGRYRLLGFVRDCRPLLEVADAFVLSSTSEGMPNALLEAMAMEVPVVATRVGAVPQIISDGESGLTCRPGDLEDLSAAMGRVLSDRALAERLRSAGRQVVEGRFSFRRRMDRIREVYENVLGPAGDGVETGARPVEPRSSDRVDSGEVGRGGTPWRAG